MPSFTYTITASQAELDNFADRLAYMTTTINEQGQVIPNPKTRMEHFAEVTGEHFAKLFCTPFVEDIDREVRNQRDIDKENMRNAIRGRITVTYNA